jgi:16S rRNA (guanine527-N7)-methyltransferase
VVEDLDIAVDNVAFDRMLQHEALLQAWNPRVNLTRIIEPAEVARRHFGEALFLAREIGLTSGTIADLGAGAGFPGLPIAAWQPAVQVTAVESVTKKTTFLREVSRDWSNVSLFEGRIEAVEETFDWVVMRAVAIEPLLEELAKMAPRAALLAGSRALEALEKTDLWTLKHRIELPWDAPGALLIAERAQLSRFT